MELDDLKTIWQKQEKMLNANLKVNEQILQNIKFNRSNNQIRKLLNYEVSSIIIYFGAFALTLFFTSRYLQNLKFSIPGIISCIIWSAFMLLCAIKVNDYNKIKDNNDEVVTIQKKLAQLKIKVLKIRKIEYMLIPVILISIFPILFIGLRNIDIYERPITYILITAICCLVSFPIIIWYNRSFYDKSIKIAEELFNSMTEFEKE